MGAVLSDCGRYRYSLTRTRKECERYSKVPYGDPNIADGPAIFIMLNPSTADAEINDPTIRRCMRFAAEWGCDGLKVVNLFALRATDPMALWAEETVDPVGEHNHHHVMRALQFANDDKSPVVCAWGRHGPYMGQDQTMIGWLEDAGIDPLCLKVLTDGQPMHPLMAPATSRLIPYKPPTPRN